MSVIGVVIPSLGNHDGLAAVLAGFARQREVQGGLELVVGCDLAEPDPERVERICGAAGISVTMVRGELPGASANRNAGVRATSAPLLLFCDNDTVPAPDLVARHLEHHRARSDWRVAVLGRVRWAPNRSVSAFMRWLDHGIQFDYPSIDGDEAGWGRFYSANVSVKRTLFEEVGGFDEERLPYLYEDLDFGYRASKLGLELLYEPRALVDHHADAGLDMWRERVTRLARAERAFVAKHPEIEPYYLRLFSAAIEKPPARGRGRRLIRWIPRRLPRIGPYVWTSAELHYLQLLAPAFLEAWEAGRGPAQPDRSSHPSGSSPGGPK